MIQPSFNTKHIQVDYHEGKLLPYTVWVNGYVAQFCATAEEVEKFLNSWRVNPYGRTLFQPA